MDTSNITWDTRPFDDILKDVLSRSQDRHTRYAVEEIREARWKLQELEEELRQGYPTGYEVEGFLGSFNRFRKGRSIQDE